MSNFEFENRNCEFNNTINFIFHLNPNSGSIFYEKVETQIERRHEIGSINVQFG